MVKQVTSNPSHYMDSNKVKTFEGLVDKVAILKKMSSGIVAINTKYHAILDGHRQENPQPTNRKSSKGKDGGAANPKISQHSDLNKGRDLRFRE